MAGPSTSTTRALFAVSGNKCAFPDCQVPIYDEEHAVIIGEICHIEADRPGGPRYNPQQSNEERQAFENLLLMCANHHKIIDSNPVSYNVAMIKEIKADHEKLYANGKVPSDSVIYKLLQIIDDTDLRILSTLPMSGPSLTPVFLALGNLGIEEVELGDRLEMLAEKGMIQLAGLGGSYAPKMTLSNGIHNVGLTAKGRQFLRGQR
jgi:hypothetical protein